MFKCCLPYPGNLSGFVSKATLLGARRAGHQPLHCFLFYFVSSFHTQNNVKILAPRPQRTALHSGAPLRIMVGALTLQCHKKAHRDHDPHREF